MKLFHLNENNDYNTYYENGVKKTVYLRHGEVSLEEFQEYCKIFNEKVDFSAIIIDRIENDTLYFCSDII